MFPISKNRRIFFWPPYKSQTIPKIVKLSIILVAMTGWKKNYQCRPMLIPFFLLHPVYIFFREYYDTNLKTATPAKVKFILFLRFSSTFFQVFVYFWTSKIIRVRFAYIYACQFDSPSILIRYFFCLPCGISIYIVVQLYYTYKII